VGNIDLLVRFPNGRRCPIAVEIDLEHPVDRFADDGELVKRGAEQFPLQRAADRRDQDDQAGMQRLRRVETPEIAGVIGDEDKVSVACIAHNVPVFPSGLADMCYVLGVMARLPGDGNQVGAETFVDQEPHDTAMVSTRRRALCAGF
jgi:hypothetical protein